MDNQTPPPSSDTNDSSANQPVTHSEHNTQDTDIFAHLDTLLGAAIKRQQAKREAKQKRRRTHEGIGEGTGQLIDLAALNLSDVPYYVDPNPPISLPDESD